MQIQLFLENRATYCSVFFPDLNKIHCPDHIRTQRCTLAVGKLDPPATTACDAIEGRILVGACRWFAMRVADLDDKAERTTIVCRTVAQGEQRPFFGLNRAKHAGVEGAILATRLHLLEAAEVARQFDALRPLVEKTGGDAERRAFAFLEDFLRSNNHGTV